MITPRNEQGVVVLFQELSRKLGYELVSVQVPFPDAVVKDNKGREYKVEFEYASSNFIAHKHEIDGCDMIICWIDNTNNFPIPVISLKNYLETLSYQKEQSLLNGLQIGLVVSTVSWITLGISVALSTTDMVLQSLIVGNLILFFTCILGLLFHNLSKKS